jgi:tetratricopeptide (TPR) repeat protein
MSGDGSRDRPIRLALILHGDTGDAGDASYAEYEGRVGDVVAHFRAAITDQALLQELLGQPSRGASVDAARRPRYRRLSLARLLLLQAEAELFTPGGDPLLKAALARVIVDRLIEHGERRARPLAAMVLWLLGKGLLKSGRRRLARMAFASMRTYLQSEQAEEMALLVVGLAQLFEDSGEVDAATCLWLQAGRAFMRLDAPPPVAACQAQLGLWLAAQGDLTSAVTALSLAVDSIDSGLAPSLAARVRLALAEVQAALGDLRAADEQLATARELYALAPSSSEAVARSWAEARIAAARRRDSEAEALFEAARGALVARGSLAEAVRVTWDQAMLRIETGRGGRVEGLTAALAAAFGEAGARWARAIETTARHAAERPEASYRLCADMRRRLRGQFRRDPRRPPLLLTPRMLADRLLRRGREREDPLAAMQEGA